MISAYELVPTYCPVVPHQRAQWHEFDHVARLKIHWGFHGANMNFLCLNLFHIVRNEVSLFQCSLTRIFVEFYPPGINQSDNSVFLLLFVSDELSESIYAGLTAIQRHDHCSALPYAVNSLQGRLRKHDCTIHSVDDDWVRASGIEATGTSLHNATSLLTLTCTRPMSLTYQLPCFAS